MPNYTYEDLMNNLEHTELAKERIKQAIINKKVSIKDEDTFISYANKINAIEELRGMSVVLTPSTEIQNIVPDENYNAITNITLKAVTSDIDENIKPENIKIGTSILGVSGTVLESTGEQGSKLVINDSSTMEVQGSTLFIKTQ